MRVLVTGADGFTGRYVCAALGASGHSVFKLESNLVDLAAMESELNRLKPESVIHLAAVAFVGHDSANSFYESNLIGTRNLLEAIYNTVPDIQSVLLVSSANIYGNQSEGALNEGVLPDPANDYAVSKLAMEHMARLWSDRVPVTIVRPFNYTGVGQGERFLIPKIVKHFREALPVIELGNLDVWREFGDVRAVASIYRQLIESSIVGETFNICTGQAYSLREVIALCESITGHGIELKVNPEFVRENEIPVLKGDGCRLDTFLKDRKNYKLEETLRWMLDR